MPKPPEDKTFRGFAVSASQRRHRATIGQPAKRAAPAAWEGHRARGAI